MKRGELLSEIRRYAVPKRQRKRSPDAMDVGAVSRKRRESRGSPGRSEDHDWPRIKACKGTGHDEEWGGEEEWDENELGQIEEIGKGRGT